MGCRFSLYFNQRYFLMMCELRDRCNAYSRLIIRLNNAGPYFNKSKMETSPAPRADQDMKLEFRRLIKKYIFLRNLYINLISSSDHGGESAIEIPERQRQNHLVPTELVYMGNMPGSPRLDNIGNASNTLIT